MKVDHIKLQTLRNVIDANCSDLSTRPSILACVTATYLSTILSISSEPVEDVMHYVNMEHLEEINRVVSLINECAPVNVPLALSMTKKLLAVRYHTYHPRTIETQDEAGFVCTFTGVNKYLSVSEVKTLEQHAPIIFRLLRAVKDIAEA